MKVSDSKFERVEGEGRFQKVWNVVVEDSQELRIDVPNTAASIVIRAHYDGRFVIEAPQDGWIRRMFIEPGSQKYFVLDFRVPQYKSGEKIQEDFDLVMDLRKLVEAAADEPKKYDDLLFYLTTHYL